MRYFKEFYRFIKSIAKERKLIWVLAYNGFKQQYLGTHLGVIWAVIRPLAFMGVISLVFAIGFRHGSSTDGVPFYLWLLCGMIPWFYFIEGFSKGANSVTSNAYLVKKVAFKVSVLPLVNVLSALIIHFILIGIIVILFIISGYYPSVYWLQLPIYIFEMVFLLLGIAWLTSAIRVFIKDINEIIGLILQFGFWFTPIFWNIDSIHSAKIKFILSLNPMVYIISGFRDTFIYHRWFWQSPYQLAQFMLVTSVLFFFGALVFKRLRPHFGDVL